MRARLLTVLLSAVLAAGCAGKKAGATVGGTGAAAGQGSRLEPKVIMTPEDVLAGKVVKVNPGGRFVVVNFPVGHAPALEQVMPVYRNGLKVGEVKVTGMRLEDNVVADLWQGEAAVGDEVRER